MFRQTYGLYFAWLFACIGTLVSLYYSDVRHFDPCHLCWYQRVAMYPLAIILGIATYRADRSIVLYTLPLAVIGLIFAAYQIAIQEIPGWNPIDVCGSGPSCSEKYDIGLGGITIPMMAGANFFVIGVFLLLAWPSKAPRH